jgi:hypothetical protein
MVTATSDKAPQLAVKGAILARSGIYEYARDEVLLWDAEPAQDKPIYKVYRPASVLVAAKDKFSLVPVPKEHPPCDINDGNFPQYASGMTGDAIEVVPLEGGEVGLKGQIAFFTRDAYDYYMSGGRETSAGYTHVTRAVENPDEVGYDFVLDEIRDVNHVCVTQRGRGGKTVRVMDSLAVINKEIGGNMSGKVRPGFLSFIGIGKPKDNAPKFSSVLLDSVAKVHSLDAAGVEKEVAQVMTQVTVLGDSEARELLVGAVADCFKHPVEVLAAKDDVGKRVDELYGKCQSADADVVKRILDADKKDEKEDGEKKDEKEEKEDGKDKDKKKDEKKDESKESTDSKESKDSSSAVDAAVKKAVEAAVSAVADTFEKKIDASVRKALGLSEDGKSGNKDSRETDVTDSVGDEDYSSLVRGVFGQR